jgi:hypothetical protein
MKMGDAKKILEKRDRWSIAVHRYDQVNALFSAPPDRLAYFVGERGLRLNKSYQSIVADPFLFNFGDGFISFLR